MMVFSLGRRDLCKTHQVILLIFKKPDFGRKTRQDVQTLAWTGFSSAGTWKASTKSPSPWEYGGHPDRVLVLQNTESSQAGSSPWGCGGN